MTDFGPVKLGPKVDQRISALLPDLKVNKRRKAYREARAEFERIELMVREMARLYWSVGSVLRKTP